MYLREWLEKKGWSSVDLICEDYDNANCDGLDGQTALVQRALEACKVVEDWDDEEHDYSNVLYLDILQWQLESGHRKEWPNPCPWCNWRFSSPQYGSCQMCDLKKIASPEPRKIIRESNSPS